MNTIAVAGHSSLEDLGRGAGTENPFPGLRPFRPGEEQLFFGRERQVDALVDKLASHRFLVVVGVSGSGKSSLVNCGLFPALHRGLMAGAGPSWRIVQFRPGANPTRAMARAIAEDGGLYAGYAGEIPLAEVVETRLRMSSRGLVDVMSTAGVGSGTNLLLVVDQFEELFRYRRLRGPQPGAPSAADEATAFVNLLLGVPTDASSRMYVALTMRSDFLGDCSIFHGLPERVNEGQYLVQRLTRDERRAVIAGPIAVSGAEIDAALLTRLVNDVGDNPDQLSILQHALNRTWARWRHEVTERRPIALEDYETIGTMAAALDRHAEKAYGELRDDRQRRICERIFQALTDTGTDARGTRRPTTLATLQELTGASAEEVTAVIDVFRKPSRSFLMPPINEHLEPDTVVDISHESLMRTWRRLATWAEEEAQSARIYRRIADTATLYGEHRASLWRDPDLQLALEWRQRKEPTTTWSELYGGDFDRAMSFLEQSRDVRDRATAEAEFEQRWRGTWRVLVGATSAILFLVCLEIGFAPLAERLFDLAGVFHQSAGFGNRILDTLAHALSTLIALTLIGMPAVASYVALAHFGKRALRRAVFDGIAREIASPAPPLQETFEHDQVEPSVRWHTSYAPAGKRLVAYAVDAAIAMVLFVMLLFQVAIVEVALEMSLTGKSSDDMSSAGTVVAVAAWVLTTWIYQVVPVHSVWQATPGMRTAGLFVVNLDGRRMSIGRATLRHFAKPLSYVLGLGLMMQLFTARRQTLHDLLSRSVVLCRRAEDEVPAAGGPAAASLTRRAGAFAIDGALSLVILLASMLFAAMLNAGVEKARTGVVTDQMAPWSIWVAILGWLVAISIYHILALSSRLQATLGMLATGLFVTDVAGKPLAVGSATARHLLKSVSYFLGIGVLVQLLTARRQALHDLLSGSVVLRRQPASARQAPGSGLQAPGPI